ncbi:uncharacterized protein LOC105431334 [Pogonomyrmex barbatus]|uniref:Uncharacterized protein LOC105431334 n=1 Tax=Pogonomyrmex barbatus TaxID=144034 RepID=A0A6I9WPA4_9HYME|nr:uncharacterized protein LOC105431334 [Pogonomyrmex barbatus]
MCYTNYGICIKATNARVDPTSVCLYIEPTMMIKLFLVTLLCVAVFADSPADNMNQGWMGPMRAAADQLQHFMGGQDSSLVKRAASPQGPPPPPQGPPSPPQSSSN